MASSNKTSLSAAEPRSQTSVPKSVQDYDNAVARPPHIDRLAGPYKEVEKLNIQVEDNADGRVPGFLHLPRDFSPIDAQAKHHRTAAILLSGAGGGVTGPSSIYLSLAAKLASLSSNGIPALRLDYRYPARNRYCMADTKAAMDLLSNTYGLNRFVLVGWSFGGAPVFSLGGEDMRVVGCATVASQTAETNGIRRLAPRPVLLLHGTSDTTLNYSCSERLYDMYGASGDREIKLFEGDNHALSHNAMAAEKMLLSFIAKCAGVSVDKSEKENVVGKKLIDNGERMELMKKGGDLRGPENIE